MYQGLATRKYVAHVERATMADSRFLSLVQGAALWPLETFTTWDLHIWRVVSFHLSLCANYACQTAICWLSHYIGWLVWHRPEPRDLPLCLQLCGMGSLKRWEGPSPWRSSGGAVKPDCLLAFLRGFKWQAFLRGVAISFLGFKQIFAILFLVFILFALLFYFWL